MAPDRACGIFNPEMTPFPVFKQKMFRALPYAFIAFFLASSVPAIPQSIPPPMDGKPTFVLSDIKPDTPLKIVAYGDMRFTDKENTSDTNPRVRKWLAERVGAEKPDLLFLSGDMPFIGSEKADWDVYREETASWDKNHIRAYPTLGNHDMRKDRAPCSAELLCRISSYSESRVLLRARRKH